jgi:TPR repeat protein
MFGFYRSIVVIVLVGAAGISTAGAQSELHDMKIREPGEMYALGVMLDEGLGVKSDERRAFEWYKHAASLGHAESMNRLGLLYLRGSGISQNALTALAWFRRAAAKGSLKAVNNIALLHFYGFGVYQSYSEAAKFLKISAENGDADAQNKLGAMYNAGLGVAPDQRRAKSLFLQSAAQGYSPAMVNLGRMLTQGIAGETGDVFPYPFSDKSIAPVPPEGVHRALLTLSSLPSHESTSTAHPGTSNRTVWVDSCP